ncbi:MAG TPA: hypothetical protein VG847_05085 [Chitinophagaceae bacterium]|nr:hypothetical protein [Chitinophagaceae bacterium]
MNTKIIFEIRNENNSISVDMTHEGLWPEMECYNDCRKGWDFYISESLCKLFSENKGIPETPKAKR